MADLLTKQQKVREKVSHLAPLLGVLKLRATKVADIGSLNGRAVSSTAGWHQICPSLSVPAC